MKKYEIELDKAVSEFFEEIVLIVHCPIEELLSDALSKQVEIISRKVMENYVINDKNLS